MLEYQMVQSSKTSMEPNNGGLEFGSDEFPFQ